MNVLRLTLVYICMKIMEATKRRQRDTKITGSFSEKKPRETRKTPQVTYQKKFMKPHFANGHVRIKWNEPIEKHKTTNA